jgi:hypothetical protein
MNPTSCAVKAPLGVIHGAVTVSTHTLTVVQECRRCVNVAATDDSAAIPRKGAIHPCGCIGTVLVSSCFVSSCLVLSYLVCR